jgi:hypothetical protein
MSFLEWVCLIVLGVIVVPILVIAIFGYRYNRT